MEVHENLKTENYVAALNIKKRQQKSENQNGKTALET